MGKESDIDLTATRTPINLDDYRTIGFRLPSRAGTTRTQVDEAGNLITHHYDDDSRQDVTITAPTVSITTSITED